MTLKKLFPRVLLFPLIWLLFYKISNKTSERNISSENFYSRSEKIREKCAQRNRELNIDFTAKQTWVDMENKIGFSIPPKCASTTLRIIQLAKSGGLRKMGYKLDKLEGLTSKDLLPIKEWVHNLVKLDDAFKNYG